jgi:hypothetical protein
MKFLKFLICNVFSKKWVRTRSTCSQKIDSVIEKNTVIGLGKWSCQENAENIYCSVKCDSGINTKATLNCNVAKNTLKGKNFNDRICATKVERSTGKCSG